MLLPQAVHGPYDPAVFYGKKDLKLSQVKIYELPLWLMRRQFYNPIAYGRCMSRYCLARYSMKAIDPARCGPHSSLVLQELLEVEPQVCPR